MSHRPLATAATPVDAASYRHAVRHHAAGVAVITSVDGDTPVGMTISSFASHSVAPPTVSCDLATSTTSLAAIRSSHRFAVLLLDGSQEALATRFATPDLDRFAGIAWSWHDGLPLLPGILGRFTCELATEVEIGDHAIVLGTVVEVAFDPSRTPLIHQDGGFHTLGRRPLTGTPPRAMGRG